MVPRHSRDGVQSHRNPQQHRVDSTSGSATSRSHAARTSRSRRYGVLRDIDSRPRVINFVSVNIATATPHAGATLERQYRVTAGRPWSQGWLPCRLPGLARGADSDPASRGRRSRAWHLAAVVPQVPAMELSHWTGPRSRSEVAWNRRATTANPPRCAPVATDVPGTTWSLSSLVGRRRSTVHIAASADTHRRRRLSSFR